MFLNQISSYWNMRADGYSDSIHEEMDSELAQDYKNSFSKTQVMHIKL